jgi:hypothetical protein
MKKIVLVVLLLFSKNVIAQKNVENQQLIWYGYYNKLKFNDNWTLNSEIQQRQFYNPTAQHQLVLRSNIDRKLFGDWNASAGMTWFFQNPNNPTSESNLTVPELRPDIGFNQTQKVGFSTISQRYKLEARFFHDVENDRLVGGYRFSNFRFRYQLGVDFPILKKEGKEKLLLKIKNEVMINIGKKIVKNTFDQNRIYAGINYNINTAFAVEVGYMNWFQQQSSGVDFFNRDILRLSIFHTINFNK